MSEKKLGKVPKTIPIMSREEIEEQLARAQGAAEVTVPGGFLREILGLALLAYEPKLATSERDLAAEKVRGLEELVRLADTSLQKLVGHCTGHNCMIDGCAEARKLQRKLAALADAEGERK